MNSVPGFAAKIRAHHERDPSREDRRLAVLLKITVSSAQAASHTQIAEAVVLDGSGSMLYPRTKVQRAQEAACAAVDTLPDGALFAVLEGGVGTRMIYPRGQNLATLSDRIRQDAKQAIQTLRPGGGGTDIGSWLDGARELLEPYGDHRRHTTLLTDGRNNPPRHVLDRAIEACRPVLSCDARGIGKDWNPDELLHIVEGLHGSAPALPVFGDLAGDFTEVMRRLIGSTVPALTLRVRCGKGVTLGEAEQAHPAIMNMAQHITADSTKVIDFSLGTWGDETRDYLLTFDADPSAALEGGGHRIARFDLLAGPSGTEVPGTQTYADVHWSTAPGRPSLWLSRYDQRRELAMLLGSGCRAWLASDPAVALRDWRNARTLAERLGDGDSIGMLRMVLEGDVLHPEINEERVKQVQFGSTKTTTSEIEDREEHGGTSGHPAPRTCPECGRVAPPGANFCEFGGHELSDEGPAR